MLETLLQLDPVGSDAFETNNHQQNFQEALFGGQALAQSLMAAINTVDNLQPHSLHAYFLRPGTTAHPITYRVERVRDGRTVSNRRVRAEQCGKIIYEMMCSFHKHEDGYEHQITAANSILPEALLPPSKLGYSPASMGTGEFSGEYPLDYIAYDNALFTRQANPEPDFKSRFWMKTKETLAEPMAQFGALAFTTDVGLLAAALVPHPASLFSRDVIAASMDHSIWFHRLPKLHEWHQFITDSPWAGNARGLCGGHVYDQEGVLVASVAQEGLIRPRAKA